MKKNCLISSRSLRQTAAEVLAAAVLDLCPDAHIIEGRATTSGFAYHFYFPSPFSEEMLPFIEERMRELIRQDLPIKHREMMPDNAAQFFQHYPRYYPSFFAKQEAGPLVDVFEMRGFADLCPGPYATSTGELGAIKLLGVSKRPPIRYRGEEKAVLGIEGVLSDTPQQLKEFLKMRKTTESSLFLTQKSRGKHGHEVHRCFWLPEGERVRNTLMSFWKDIHIKEGFEIVQTQGNHLLKNHEEFFGLCQHKAWKVAELSREVSDEGMSPWKGLFDSKDYSFDRAHTFCLKEALKEELISSLQFLEKTSKMLGFEATLSLFIPKKDREFSKLFKEVGLEGALKVGKLPRIEWEILDRSGQKRTGPFIELRKGEKGWVITHSFFNQLERFIALLMEARGPSFDERMKDIAKKRNFK